MTEPTQATTDDEPTTKPQPGDRVFARAKGDDFGRTGTIDEIHDGPHSITYVVDLDGSGEAHVSRNVFYTEADLDMLDRMKNVETVDEVIDALEQVRDMLDGGDA